MNFLFVSRYALIHDLAWQIQREGHGVRYWIQSKADRDVADGIVPKVERWEDHKDWADVIIFDDSDFGEVCERLRREGKAVVGGTRYTDRLESDRDFAAAEMAACGLTTLPSWEFTSFDAAIDFIRAHPERYVVKPSGRAQNDKVLSYVGQEEDGRDVVTVLEHYKKGWGARIRSFQLQKFAAGVEVAVGAFANGRGFVLPCFINFEHKRMFNGNIGPSTGEMGTLAFWAGATPLFEETLAKMQDRIAGYVGYFDINCIATPHRVYPLEITPRFGYPTINLQLEGVSSKWGEFMGALARGESFSLRTKRGFQIAVVVAVPPFPFVDAEAFQKYSADAAVIFKKPNVEGVHPCDVKIVDGTWLLAGNSGYALVVTGSASTVEEARREAYGRVKNVLIPNMFYRTDIGERWFREGDLLQTWGLLGT
ncbi:MAG: phosphoribosylamine--glycine ligase [Planctomycetes bacterium]|nr:phosphoribosylamine--glycine ligase [Planctomycetota bacterium]